jgi:hypothetical protein
MTGASDTDISPFRTDLLVGDLRTYFRRFR